MKVSTFITQALIQTTTVLLPLRPTPRAGMILTEAEYINATGQLREPVYVDNQRIKFDNNTCANTNTKHSGNEYGQLDMDLKAAWLSSASPTYTGGQNCPGDWIKYVEVDAKAAQRVLGVAVEFFERYARLCCLHQKTPSTAKV